MIVGILGGSGMTEALLEPREETRTIATTCGEAEVHLGTLAGCPVAFVTRHGSRHALLPHQVNYRANALALQTLGVRRVVATSAVGSLRSEMPPGSLVLLADFIDFTRARPWTLAGPERFPDSGCRISNCPAPDPSAIQNPKPKIENPDTAARFHLDMTEPYCPALRAALADAAEELGLTLLPRATYVCVEGPRYESHAEIRMFQAWGADVVGMTGMPEVTLAREVGQCYASVALVTNMGAGLTADVLRHTDVEAGVAAVREQVAGLLAAAVPRIAALEECPGNCQSQARDPGGG
jgi:5'-methylthioadenosine phosphorylase